MKNMRTADRIKITSRTITDNTRDCSALLRASFFFLAFSVTIFFSICSKTLMNFLKRSIHSFSETVLKRDAMSSVRTCQYGCHAASRLKLFLKIFSYLSFSFFTSLKNNFKFFYKYQFSKQLQTFQESCSISECRDIDAIVML